MHDPRSIANYILELAEEDDRQVSNIMIQKLVYFCHAYFLHEHDRPLVTGYFEAWTYGPVHPALYKSFKIYGANKITGKADKTNLLTGEVVEVESVNDKSARRTIRTVMSNLAKLSIGQLVDLSHAPNGPWHFTVENSKTEANLGLRIADDVTKERFKYLKLAVGKPPRSGEPDEDAPFG